MADAQRSWESVLALSLGSGAKIVAARQGLEMALSANAGPDGDVFDVLPRSGKASDGQLLVHASHATEDRGVRLAQALSGFLRELLGEVCIGVGTMRTDDHSLTRLTKMADLALYVAKEAGPPVVPFTPDLLDRLGPEGPAGSLADLRPGDPPRTPHSPLGMGRSDRPTLLLGGFQLRVGAHPGWTEANLRTAYASAERVSREEWRRLTELTRATSEYQEYFHRYADSASSVIPHPPAHVHFLPFRQPTVAVVLWLRRDGKQIYLVHDETEGEGAGV